MWLRAGSEGVASRRQWHGWREDAEADHMRDGYQEMAAKGFISFQELRARLEELKNSRGVAVQELEALRGRR
jgi:hypothetical protein